MALETVDGKYLFNSFILQAVLSITHPPNLQLFLYIPTRKDYAWPLSVYIL